MKMNAALFLAAALAASSVVGRTRACQPPPCPDPSGILILPANGSMIPANAPGFVADYGGWQVAPKLVRVSDEAELEIEFGEGAWRFVEPLVQGERYRIEPQETQREEWLACSESPPVSEFEVGPDAELPSGFSELVVQPVESTSIAVWEVPEEVGTCPEQVNVSGAEVRVTTTLDESYEPWRALLITYVTNRGIPVGRSGTLMSSTRKSGLNLEGEVRSKCENLTEPKALELALGVDVVGAGESGSSLSDTEEAVLFCEGSEGTTSSDPDASVGVNPDAGVGAEDEAMNDASGCSTSRQAPTTWFAGLAFVFAVMTLRRHRRPVNLRRRRRMHVLIALVIGFGSVSAVDTASACTAPACPGDGTGSDPSLNTEITILPRQGASIPANAPGFYADYGWWRFEPKVVRVSDAYEVPIFEADGTHEWRFGEALVEGESYRIETASECDVEVVEFTVGPAADLPGAVSELVVSESRDALLSVWRNGESVGECPHQEQRDGVAVELRTSLDESYMPWKGLLIASVLQGERQIPNDDWSEPLRSEVNIPFIDRATVSTFCNTPNAFEAAMRIKVAGASTDGPGSSVTEAKEVELLCEQDTPEADAGVMDDAGASDTDAGGMDDPMAREDSGCRIHFSSGTYRLLPLLVVAAHLASRRRFR